MRHKGNRFHLAMPTMFPDNFNNNNNNNNSNNNQFIQPILVCYRTIHTITQQLLNYMGLGWCEPQYSKRHKKQYMKYILFLKHNHSYLHVRKVSSGD